MSILFDATRPVKSNTSFGRGILPGRRERFIPSQADREWAAANLNANATDYDVIPPPAAELDAEADAAFFANYAPDPSDWAEYDAWASAGGAWGSHPDRINV